MTDHHVIETVQVDIAFAEEDVALREQASLGDFAKRRMLAVVDDVLNEMSPRQGILRIDRLEIDLGTVGHAGYQQELVRRLQMQLREKLSDEITALSQTSSSPFVSPAESALEQLEYFVRHGYLPWRSQIGSVDLELLVSQAIDDGRRVQLVSSLQGLLQDRTAARRLVLQFSDSSLGDLVGALNPSLESVSRALVQDFIRLWRQGPVMVKSEREFRDLVWEQLFAAVTSKSSVSVSPEALLSDVIERLSRSNERFSDELRTALDEAFGSPSRSQPLRREWLSVLQRSGRENSTGDAEGDDQIRERRDEGRALVDWRRRVSDAFLRGDPGPVRSIWAVLMRDHPEIIITSWLQHARSPRTRQRVANGFSESLLLDMLALFVPDHAPMIRVLLRRKDLLAMAFGVSRSEIESVSRVFWDFALGYAVVTDAPPFEGGEFLIGLVRHLERWAADADFPKASIADVRASRVQLEELGVPRGLFTPGDAARPAGVSRQEQEVESSNAAVRSYDVYDRLVRLLHGFAPLEAEQSQIALLEEATQTHPAEVLNFARLLASGGIRPPDETTTQPQRDARHFLGRLLRTVLAVQRQWAVGQIAAFMEAVDGYAGGVTDFRRFYGLVLYRVLRNQEIDLDAIADATVSRPGQRETGEAPSVSGESQPDPSGLGEQPEEPPASGNSGEEEIDSASVAMQARRVYNRLVHLLQGTAPSGSERSQTALFEEATRSFPAEVLKVARLLQSGGVRPSNEATARSRLASWDLLHRLLGVVLEVHKGWAVGQIADFVAAVDAYVAGITDLQRFYGLVLYRVLHDDEMDLDAIAEARTSPPGREQTDQVRRSGDQTRLDAGPADGKGERRPAPAANDSRESGPDGEGHSADAFEPPADETTGEDDSEAAAPNSDVAILVAYLRDGSTLSGEAVSQALSTFQDLLSRDPGRFRALFGSVLQEEAAAIRAVELLPERLLDQVLRALRPHEYRLAQPPGDILANALADVSIARGWRVTFHQAHRLKWQFLIRYLVVEDLPFVERPFIRRFIQHAARAIGLMAPDELSSSVAEQVEANQSLLPRDRHSRLLEVLRDKWDHATDVKEAPLPLTTAERRQWRSSSRQQTVAGGEGIYIENAGQVIATPYLPRLFDLLGLTETQSFRDRASAERASHLLQFMVNGSANSPEYQLPLNKLLCGIPLSQPIIRDIDPTEQEKETVEGLIQGMIQNWGTIRNTSVSGFRTSFLQREGRLQHEEDSWHLLIEQRAFDVLLDSLPWSFATIRYPWMHEVIHVEWR